MSHVAAGGNAPPKLPPRRRPPAAPAKSRPARPGGIAGYRRVKGGIDAYVRALADADPLQLMQVERDGVEGSFVKDLAAGMGIAASRFFVILGLPKATIEKKAAAGQRVAGSGGQAAIGMAKLLATAQRLVSDSTAPQARGFDAAKWLGRWIEQPQPALGGLKPSDMLDTPTGMAVVARLLGALESGAYQ
jgi:uncharacterized protein (DUF2384 family)